jgi:hypothetical protein
MTPEFRRPVEEACLNGWPAFRELLFDVWRLRVVRGPYPAREFGQPDPTGRAALTDKIARSPPSSASARSSIPR